MNVKLKNLTARAACFALASAPMLAMAVDPTTPEEAITSGKVAVLAIAAIGGLAMVVIALGSVGWGVGAKFIKRLRGAA
ncbi:hypothetical protein [Caenimonas soli]|uniref:hypothetical protein n=1 Tax=Caenimonas soli TaxID=2735555 RepID=UPI0015567F15|nr:hypothetical protein [Caenimonas soli]NPC57012.1 hypothetical protein [Caenimonas soli]